MTAKSRGESGARSRVRRQAQPQAQVSPEAQALDQSASALVARVRALLEPPEQRRRVVTECGFDKEDRLIGAFDDLVVDRKRRRGDDFGEFQVAVREAAKARVDLVAVLLLLAVGGSDVASSAEARADAAQERRLNDERERARALLREGLRIAREVADAEIHSARGDLLNSRNLTPQDGWWGVVLGQVGAVLKLDQLGKSIDAVDKAVLQPTRTVAVIHSAGVATLPVHRKSGQPARPWTRILGLALGKLDVPTGLVRPLLYPVKGKRKKPAEYLPL